MTPPEFSTVRALGWAGMLPFALLVVVAIVGAPDPLKLVLLSYGVAILAFLCGSLWSVLITQPPSDARALVVSNALLLAAVPAPLLPLTWACLLLAVLFVLQAVAEGFWLRGRMPRRYVRLRLQLTPSAVALLLLAALAASHRG